MKCQSPQDPTPVDLAATEVENQFSSYAAPPEIQLSEDGSHLEICEFAFIGPEIMLIVEIAHRHGLAWAVYAVGSKVRIMLGRKTEEGPWYLQGVDV